MDHFAGLDVSVKETSVCIVDDAGRIVKEVKVSSEPEALLKVLGSPIYRFKRMGLEAGPLSQWLFSGLAEAGLPVVCVETRHMQAVLKAQINKTDRNDARGIAQMMRVGLYRPVHVKTLRSQKLRMLLTHRKLLQSKTIDIENDLRGTLRNFGLKVGMVGTVRFEARIRELVEDLPELAALIEPLLIVRRTLREQVVILHRRLLAIVRDDEVCQRLMTIPGVGPVVSLTYRATVDVPARFRKSKSVGAVFGLTCSRYQSGELDLSGRISRCGDEMMRVMLYEAARSMMYSKKWSWLKAWAMQIAKRRGMKKAIVALARRLAVIMHRIWVDGTEFRWTREQAPTAV
jgi:transposase